MSDTTNFLTPVARLVSGHPMRVQTKNYDGSESNPYWFISIAIAKTDPGWPELFQKIQAAGQAGHAPRRRRGHARLHPPHVQRV